MSILGREETAVAEGGTPGRRGGVPLAHRVGVAVLVLLLGCGQGETTGLAETGVEPAVTSTVQTPKDTDTDRELGEGAADPPLGRTTLAPGELLAVIDDPDGYTNVRAGQGTNYDVVTTVLEDEAFYVSPQGGDQDWWPVRTTSGHSGFMHRSRIDLVED